MIPFPPGKYGVILADPPWRFKAYSPKGNGRAAPYETMSIEDIAALPVASLAAKDCLLVMWTTAPLLRLSMSVLEAWGATFVTAGSWAKTQADGELAKGTGYRWRSSSEFWLAGKYGSPPRYHGPAIPNCIIAPRRDHSRKPPRLHEDLERMFPDVPRIELFGRASRHGWTVWGNQSTLFDGEPT